MRMRLQKDPHKQIQLPNHQHGHETGAEKLPRIKCAAVRRRFVDDFKNKPNRAESDFVAGRQALSRDGEAVDVHAVAIRQVADEVAVGAPLNGGMLVAHAGIGELQAAVRRPANQQILRRAGDRRSRSCVWLKNQTIHTARYLTTAGRRRDKTFGWISTGRPVYCQPMEVRCQNCDARLSVPATGPLKKAPCPNCGIMALIPLTKPRALGREEKHAQKKERAGFKRIFEPIPRSAAYAGGLLLIFLLTSPFWISDVMDSLQRRSPYVSHNTDGTAASTNAVPARDLTLYNDVRLEAHRDIMEHRFGLTLQNTRGMRPEIYIGHNIGDIEMITAFFYDGLLKETTLVMRERPVTTETIQLELIELYGEPQTRTREESKTPQSGLTGLRGIAGSDDLNSKLANLKHRNSVLWTDGKVRLDALIYSGDADTSAVLQVHLAATDWLQANQSALRTVGLKP